MEFYQMSQDQLKLYLESKGYQPKIMHPSDIFEDEVDEEIVEEEQGCSCSTGCMDCQGMSWRDFM